MAESYDVVVIGSGPGGYAAAIRCAQRGVSVAIVEKELIGGKAKVPMVLRPEGGIGRCIAAHHSESLEAAAPAAEAPPGPPTTAAEPTKPKLQPTETAAKPIASPRAKKLAKKLGVVLAYSYYNKISCFLGMRKVRMMEYLQ